MKKFAKISTVVLATGMLTGGTYTLLANQNHVQPNQQNLFNTNINTIDNAHQQDISIALQAVTNSQMKMRPNIETSFDDALSGLKAGQVADSNLISKLIVTEEFPMGAKFTINEITIDRDASVIILNLNPDKLYKDGTIVNFAGSGVENYLVGLIFNTAVPVANDNTGLIIGLSVGGGVLLLIIIGLIIWYMRRRGGGYGGGRGFSFHNPFEGMFRGRGGHRGRRY